MTGAEAEAGDMEDVVQLDARRKLGRLAIEFMLWE